MIQIMKGFVDLNFKLNLVSHIRTRFAQDIPYRGPLYLLFI